MSTPEFDNFMNGVFEEMPDSLLLQMRWIDRNYTRVFSHLNPDSQIGRMALNIKDTLEQADTTFADREQNARFGMEYEAGERETLKYNKDAAIRQKDTFRDFYNGLAKQLISPADEDGTILPYDECVEKVCKALIVDIRTDRNSNCTDEEREWLIGSVRITAELYVEEADLHFQNLERA